MSTYSRLNGRKITLSDDKLSHIVRTIKANPGRMVRDYEIILAGKEVYVSLSDINLALECTNEGKKLVRAGKVAYRKTRGRAASWTMIRGATINAPAADYVPSVFQPRRLTDPNMNAAIAADANHMLEMVSDVITRPSRGRHRYASLTEISLQIENTARREDSRAKEVEAAEILLSSAHSTIVRLTQTVQQFDQGTQVLLGHLNAANPTPVVQVPAPTETSTPEPA